MDKRGGYLIIATTVSHEHTSCDKWTGHVDYGVLTCGHSDSRQVTWTSWWYGVLTCGHSDNSRSHGHPGGTGSRDTDTLDSGLRG